MNDSARCLKCGGTNLTPGNLNLAYLLVPVCVFRPDGGSGASYKSHTVLVHATMCLDCGFLEMSGDPEAAKAVIERIQTGR